MLILTIIFIIYFSVPALADDFITDNIINGCGNSYSYSAIFEPIVYNCANGYFLPAGAVSCEKCPPEYTCPGGQYTFSATNTQGITEGDILVQNAIGSCTSDFNQSFSALFEPIVYTCSSGFYLPAGNDWIDDSEGCRPCLNDNYCAGGTYTFNETESQGIIQCPESAPNAPVGMWAESQCGRKLHVGDDFLYVHKSPATPNEHRLYVKFEDIVYSVNATPVSENPNLKMSANAQRSLHVKIDGVEYLVHDDSVR